MPPSNTAPQGSEQFRRGLFSPAAAIKGGKKIEDFAIAGAAGSSKANGGKRPAKLVSGVRLRAESVPGPE
jgi:hypothetical protein